MSRRQTIIYCEGKTEVTLLRTLGVIGKLQEMNLWERDLNRVSRHWNRDTQVYVVFDTDVTHNADRFLANLSVLNRAKVLRGLVQQSKNLEHELVRSCFGLRDTAHLYATFNNAQGANEFKGEFCDCSNVLAKLKQVGFNPDALWSEPLISVIPHTFKNFQVRFRHLPKR